MTTQEQTNQNNETKLYANKFKTVEELENGYKASLPTFQENETLKKQVADLTKVPDDYSTPTDIALHESDLAIVKREAKNSGLTQPQYEKLVRERNALSTSKNQSFEEAKKELGADNINLLQDFLNKSYPDKVAESLLKQAITNKEVREQILAQRTAALNSGAPGMNRVNIGGAYAVTQKDVLKARDEMNASRGRQRVEAQGRYVALQRAMAHQKNGG